MSQYLQQPTPRMVPPGQAYYVPPQRHGLAIPSLIAGVLSIPMFVIAPIGLILGLIALVGIKKSRGMKTGSGLAIAGFLCSVIGLGIAVKVMGSPPSKDRIASGQRVTPNADLDVAERNIITDVDGVAYSNSDEGYTLAKSFAGLMKKAALMSTDDLDKGVEFVTHCQLHDDSVAFITHVPKLRKFDGKSKETFCDMAWSVAQSVLANAGIDADLELAVGVKGNLLYESIYLGTYKPLGADGSIPKPDRKEDDKDVLERFFKGAAADAEIESEE
jgi:hypothetical protein